VKWLPAMLKVELHAHTADDPVDHIPYSACQLIDRAATLGYGALAITLHDRQLDVAALRSFARDRGIVLISGIERTIEGKHVLLLNFSGAAEQVRDFDGLARLKRREPGLVVAPHPFFPAASCLGGRLMDRHADLFDAIERNAMYTRAIDFNARAERWAARHGRPVVGNGDVHRLHQLGTCWSLVEAEPEPDAICDAIASGRVRAESRPLTVREAAGTVADLFLTGTTVGRAARPLSPVRATIR
jgi:predicted metal-dependent phosphoesterase TrpH